MSQMFCFQCEQTAGSRACVGMRGVCGKDASNANAQDRLTGALIGLARAAKGKTPGPDCDTAVLNALFTTITNVSFDEDRTNELTADLNAKKEALGGANDFDMADLWNDNEDIRSLKTLTLLGLRGMAAYAEHALVLGHTDPEVNAFIYDALRAIGDENDKEKLLNLVLETGRVNYLGMELLDRANTSAYGEPVPTKVPLMIEKGPFIVVSGHDLRDLRLLLEQTQGKGINIYTHGEMLPCHAYPKLKEFSHLKGNFGTAWQNQQKEFDAIPAPILFTTNCLMPVKPSYADRVFTTGAVAYPEMIHIDSKKDFTPVIEKALELGGYDVDTKRTGINGGEYVMTGFGKNTVLSAAPEIIKAVKERAISHFFLVGGCDGAKPGRNYYTNFVKNTPRDTVVLTLACGKFRFNDLDLGEIRGFPRIMDMGQCNDAYSAIRVAIALSEAFECDINELPLSLILSWYEQKAVCVLLTLLWLGMKNIYLGPTLPAFVSPNVFEFLSENYGVRPISNPEHDLAEILSR